MKTDKPKRERERRPKREPQRRSPAVREEGDDLDFEIPDPSIPQPYQVPGFSHPPMQLHITAWSRWHSCGGGAAGPNETSCTHSPLETG